MSKRIDEPGRSYAPTSLEISILAARYFDAVTLFVNAMNHTDERQTKQFPLRRAASEAWGSLTGRVVNVVGLRCRGRSNPTLCSDFLRTCNEPEARWFAADRRLACERRC